VSAADWVLSFMWLLLLAPLLFIVGGMVWSLLKVVGYVAQGLAAGTVYAWRRWML
jgi:hypothetical protein